MPDVGLLERLAVTASTCTRCPLAEGRTQVVFGVGHPSADLLFGGEGPGREEALAGEPFVGRSGKLLDRLMWEELALTRAECYIANVVKCRPPNNRDPNPDEIEACRPYLAEQIEIIDPAVIVTLGNFSTKLLRGDPTGITRLHGQPEVITIGRRAVRLYPIYHPAAALYTPRMLQTLREDFQRLPELLALGPPEQPPPGAFDEEAEAFEAAGQEIPAELAPQDAQADQLGLF